MKAKAPPPEIRPGQVWRLAKRGTFFVVETVDVARSSAQVTTSTKHGLRLAGRKPYHVTTRTFGRRYLLAGNGARS